MGSASTLLRRNYPASQQSRFGAGVFRTVDIPLPRHAPMLPYIFGIEHNDLHRSMSLYRLVPCDDPRRLNNRLDPHRVALCPLQHFPLLESVMLLAVERFSNCTVIWHFQALLLARVLGVVPRLWVTPHVSSVRSAYGGEIS